ncbi:MAG TPA: hypothetical protein PLS63_01045 [Microthrixaceae bacterium]|nr:hypothetical protein [Microthrixaceae bacterium]
MTDTGVRRSTELDLDTASTLRALTDPELLSIWIGRWDPIAHEHHVEDLDPDSAAGRQAIVTTDDGVRRSVEQLEVRPDGVRWRWAPVDSPEDMSDVVLSLEAIAADRTRLTVTEVPSSDARSTTAARPATVALDAIKWSICLLVLELAAAQSTVAVSV